MHRSRRREGRRFSNEERLLMYRRVLEGRSYPEIAAEFDSSLNAMYRAFGARRDRPLVRRHPSSRLSLEEREEITGG